MADLAKAAVVFNRRAEIGDRTGKLIGKLIDATCTLVAMGTATNKIPASVLGLTEIYEVRSCRADGNTLLLASPSYDGTYVNLYDVSGATDATRDDPVDITDTIRLIVIGRE